MAEHRQSHGINDFLEDVPMEIGTAFFPPPVVVLNNHRLRYPSRLLENTYEFGAEKAAEVSLSQFEASKAAKSPVGEERPRSASQPPASGPDPSTSAAPPRPTLSAAPPPTAAPLAPLSFRGAGGILTPQPMANGAPAVAPTQQLSRVSLEDFDSASASRSPFDALEIHSIDDRALLRQVLG